MDKITDYFKHFSDRFRNPLIFSFLIYWCLFNWRTIIAVFLYDKSDLAAEKVNTINQYISKTVTTSTGVTKPLLWAIGFTLVYPIITAGLYILYGKIRSIGRDWHLEWIKGSTIPTLEFIELQKNTDTLLENLENVYKQKAVYQGEKATYVRNLAEKDTEINNLKDRLNFNNNLSSIQGHWNVERWKNDPREKESWEIKGDTISRVGAYGEILLPLKIITFARSNSEILIRFEKTNRQKSFVYHVLTADDWTEDRTMQGFDQDGFQIRYVFSKRLAG